MYNNVRLLTMFIYIVAYGYFVIYMMRDNVQIREKLYELGKLVGLEEREIDQSKRTAKNVIKTFIIIGIIALIGIFTISRFESLGLWYITPSIKDFSFFSRLF